MSVLNVTPCGTGALREIIAHVNNELGTLWGKLAAIAVKRQSVVVQNEYTV